MRSCNTSSFLAHNAKQLLNILLDEVFVLQSELKNLRIRDLGWGYLPLCLGLQQTTNCLQGHKEIERNQLEIRK